LVVSLDIPFGEDGAIDFPALERLVDFHLREGAIGFLVPAQAAEVFDLTLAERLDVLRAVRSASCGRGLVVAGATSANLDESLAVAKEAARCGCEGVLAEPPAACPQTIQHMLEFFRPLADAGPPCLMIQDLDWHGSGLPVELVVELYHQLPQFGSLKVEVNPAGPKYTAVREATQGKLHLSGGWAALQMIEALDRGVDVFMNTALTRLYRAVIDAYDAGDRPAALRHFYRMLPVLAFTRQHLDVSIHFHKRQFQHLGIFPTARVRKAGLAWDAFFEKQTVDLLAYIDQLYEEARVSPR
jgi:4-hydroxy-tetrahydrodipicolinate synthase